jgi:TRAP-type C4-dicarboxylate transport system permease small subunit
LRKALDFLYDAAGYLAAFFIFAIFATMVGSSVLRELGFRTGGTDDVVSWMCAAAAFLAMAHAFKHGDFVRVVLLLDNVGPARRRAFEIGGLAIASVFLGALAWAAARFVYDSWQFNDMPSGLIALPLWIPQSSFVVGALLFFIAAVDELVCVLRGAKPAYVLAVEERHARGDFTEDL